MNLKSVAPLARSRSRVALKGDMHLASYASRFHLLNLRFIRLIEEVFIGMSQQSGYQQ